uniref:MgtC/SapB family protein n=1 Tax=Acetatifactor sp. TaxID=1872090 RepID=UPI004057CAD5
MNLGIKEILDIVIKLVLALICGGILGIERERKKRPAGFRTYMLVCLGATLVMMTNQYIYEYYNTGDPARMASQVISGIGFLGAGTIIVTGHNRVKGLTTAAGLWAAACVGLAIGIGYYEAAVIGCVMIFLAMVIMHGFERRITTSAKLLLIYVEMDRLSALKTLLCCIREKNYDLIDMEMEKDVPAGESGMAVILSVHLPSKSAHDELIRLVGTVDGVTYVEKM